MSKSNRSKTTDKNTSKKFVKNTFVNEQKVNRCAFGRTRKILCGNESCEFCWNKSFASFDEEKVNSWSIKNNKKPHEVFKCTVKKYLFECKVCEHEFECSLNNVKKNTWCPYCSNNKLCSDEKCDFCLNNSFASSEKAIYWSNNNNVKPRDVFLSTNEKYLFKCDICQHEFEKSLGNIKYTWCPYCSNNKLCFDDTCDFCLNKSFAISEKAIYW